MKAGLPIDPARLKAQFPALTDADVEAYVATTRRILAAATDDERARITALVLATGRAARDEQPAGKALTPAQQEALRYVLALDKMQSRRQ